jgi:hypothetical protein
VNALRFSPEFRNQLDDTLLFGAANRRRATDRSGHLSELTQIIGKAGGEAPQRIVAEGHGVAFGARYLKPLIGERVKLPLTMRWNDASHFHARATNEGISRSSFVTPASLDSEHSKESSDSPSNWGCPGSLMGR